MMAHRPSHTIPALPCSSPGRPQDPYQGLWPGGDPDIPVSGMQEGTGLLALFQAIRLGSFLTDRWLGRGLG